MKHLSFPNFLRQYDKKNDPRIKRDFFVCRKLKEKKRGGREREKEKNREKDKERSFFY